MKAIFFSSKFYVIDIEVWIIKILGITVFRRDRQLIQNKI